MEQKALSDRVAASLAGVMPLPDPGVARASFLDFLNGEGHEIDPEREDWLIAMGLQ